jgi:plasmid stability protein
VATLVIRNVEDDLHIRLKPHAAAHRRSMEQEVPVLLRQGLSGAATSSLRGFGQAMRAIYEPLGGLDPADIPTEFPRDPPDLSGP